MDPRSLRVLEYPQILELLAGETITPMGREQAAGLMPATDVETCRARLRETTEAAALRASGDVPLRGVRDLRPYLRRAAAGGTLDPQELLDVAQTLEVARRLKAFLEAHRAQAPHLAELGRRITPQPQLEERIAAVVDDAGEVRDEASPRLRRIRAEQRTLERRLREQLEGILRDPAYARMVQEPLVTIRSDRFVIPIRQEARGQFPGIVHDHSTSGATLFMEPLAIVPLGNRRRELLAEARDEVRRLLAELSQLVAAQAESIAATLEALGAVDLALAKAALSERFACVEPRLEEAPLVDLRQARHPLLLRHLGSERVVPIDVELGRRFQTLVITGPNTGGKTVTLKTIGLLVLMAQAGLHIPAAETSVLGVFPQVFADIGDEQSIEQSLSTFSSHLLAIVDILAALRAPALVLLDEVAAGTDPTEGAALARAIIETLLERGAATAVTTHNNDLKALAYRLNGVENASVEFDPETLRPTFRLLIGQPGRSNALIIAQRLGLAQQVVDRARSFLSADRLRADDLLRQAASDRQSAAQDRMEAQRLRQEARNLAARYEAELARLQAERRRLAAEARREAEEWLRRTRQELEAVLREVRAARTLEAAQAAQRRLASLAAEWAERAAAEAPPEAAGAPPKQVAAGQCVFIPALARTGRVLARPDARGEVEVEVGSVRARLPLGALRLMEAGSGGSAQSAGVAQAPGLAGVPRAVPLELSLRGQTVDEALPRVDRYLDDAVLAGLPQVTLIHGRGTGALRRAVQSFLRGHPHVRAFRPGNPGEGGEGVTVVELNV